MTVEIKLEEEHEQLLQFLYACPTGLVELAVDGTIGMANPVAMQLLLPIVEKNVLTNFFEVMERYAPELRNLVDNFEKTHGNVCENYRIFVKPGTKEQEYLASVLSCTLVKVSGKRFVAAICDVSKQVDQERRLRQAETWFSSLLDEVNDFAVISLDREGRIDAVNPSFERQTGLLASEAIGQSLEVLDALDPGATMTMTEQIALTQRDGWHLNEGWQSRPGGERYWCQRLIAVRGEADGRRGGGVSGYTVVLRDVTQQQLNTDNLTKLLRVDHLTGACNRSHFFEVGERECARARRHSQPLSLIALDIDHFKAVNDTYGHGVGDKALTLFSQSCMSQLRPTDTFARVGGEEFVVLLPSTDIDGAVRLAERMRNAIAEMPIEVSGGILRITTSIGCAQAQSAEDTLAELMLAADHALYAAKRLGRNRVNIFETPHDAVCAE